MNNNSTSIKKVKFDDQRLNNFFKMLNQSTVGDKICSHQFGPEKFYPLSAIEFNDPKKLAEIKQLKANVIFVLDIGTAYDTIGAPWPNGRAKTIDERIKEAQAKIPQLEEQLNHLLELSDDPLFTVLQCKVVNTSFNVFITRKDRGDDGYDNYGIMLLLKFNYKK